MMKARASQTRSLGMAISVLIALASGACAPLPRPGGPGLAEQTAPAGQSAQPNIVLLMVDDWAWMDVGFRKDVLDTPNIDKLAARSLEFAQAYSPSPTCSPSRAGLITGRYPSKVGITRHIPSGAGHAKERVNVPEFHWLESDPTGTASRNWLPLSEVTIAERLKALGYRTGFVGKWHLGGQDFYPVHQGFDEEHGVADAGNPLNYFAPFFRDPNVYPDATPDEYLTDRVTADAVGFIDRTSGAAAPYFLTLWWYGVHTPLIGKPELVQKYLALGLEKEEAITAAMVQTIDLSVGLILDAIERSGEADNTIIILTSDQGGYLASAPLKGRKNDGLALYEGGARVPFFMTWPDRISSGTVTDQIVSLIDVAPTLVEAAGGAVDDQLDGVSLLPAIEGAPTGRSSATMYRTYEDRYAAIVEDRWKFIASWSGKHELYDLAADVGEERDLAKVYPDKVAEFAARLAQWRKINGPPNPPRE